MGLDRTGLIAIVVAAGTLLACVQPAAARDVQITGTYSASQIQDACDKVGGDFYQNTANDGGGFGCYNENGNDGAGTAIDCDDRGRCIGTERHGATKGKGAALAPAELVETLK
jgi:hypothetical protein